MDTFGERLRLLRKELHMTQLELGRLLGTDGTSISKVEADARGLSEAAIKLICTTYKVSYPWLTEGLGDMFVAESLEDLVEKEMAGQSPLAISIMKAFVRLPTEEWEKFRDMVDRIKKEGTP